jgi:hypothetical protein
MKTTTFTCLALLILTLPAARGEPLRTDINPALLYYRSFLLVPDPMSNADEEYLWSRAGREQKLPERYGKIFAGYDNQFSLVRQAAHATVPCDWGIDMSPGPFTQLPHLAPTKKVAQAAQLRAMWNLQHGNQTGARDDLLAAFVLGRNASRDGTVIGALVQNAVEALVYATVAANFNQFSPETLKQLADGFDAAPARGTMATAIMIEKSNHVDWVANKIRKLQQQNPGNDAKVLAAIRKDKDLAEFDNFGDGWEKQAQMTNFWQHVFVAAGGTSDGILKLVLESEPLYLRLVKILTLPLPEFEDQIQKFDTEVQKTQNPFVTALFPSPLQPLRRKEFRSQAEQAMVHAAVEYKLHGEAGLKSVMDPFGKGPFASQRFMFDGVDRGFELTSDYSFGKVPCGIIFVEKEGPPFSVSSPNIGKAVKP